MKFLQTSAEIEGGDEVGEMGAQLAVISISPSAATRELCGTCPASAVEAKRFLSAASLDSRCEVVEGDFFESVPAGYDAYILAHVLHDWDEARALSILRNCRWSVPSGGRLLIVKALLPDNDAPHHGKLIDLLMMTVTGGAERTAAEFSKLLAAADFEVTRILATSTHQSIIEAQPI